MLRIDSLLHPIHSPLLLLAVFSSHAMAAADCIQAKDEAQIEQQYTDESGKQATRLVAPDKLLPGAEIIYTITLSNICPRAAAGVIFDKLVPEHMTYLKGTAKGEGTDRIFSVDGKNFARFDDLRAANADGTPRAAVAEDIQAIRWIFNAPIDPGQSSVIHFHARMK